MRFEHAAAYAMGTVLPLLETLRRRTDFDDFLFYVDDFIAGGLLLFAARACSAGRASGPALLVMAWAILCGGLYGSFFGQIVSDTARDVSGMSHGVVIAVKGALYAVAIAALVRSVGAAREPIHAA